MAKSKLTKQAIKFVIQTYDDETNNFTFKQISKLIEDKFKIKVTYEAVRKAYHKHKESTEFQTPKVLKTKEEVTKPLFPADTGINRCKCNKKSKR